MLRSRGQVSLGELRRLEPVEQGLAEVVAYLESAHSTFDAVIDDDHQETILWDADDPVGSTSVRQARIPRVIFVGAR